jgi:type IV pilus assembly protein PilA
VAASEDRGFTLLELLTVVALIGILAMIGMAGLIAARRAANEASAIGSLRAINFAQYTYAASCANGYYASSLPMLAAAPPDGSPFIAPDLGAAATVHKSGFAITMARGTDSTPAATPACNPLGAASDLVNSYYATADPVNGFTGARHFWTSAHGVIFYDPNAPIQHRAALTTPTAPMLEGQYPTGGAGAGGTGKPGGPDSGETSPEGKSGGSTPDSKGAGPASPQRK